MLTSLEYVRQDLQRTKKAIVALGCSFVQGAELVPPNVKIDKHYWKYSHTFVNRLCEVYFKKEYTPINFGQEAAGNFAAISRLHLHDIPWNSLEEIIVIFMPSGMQRFDIIRDDNDSVVGNEFKTLWPFVSDSQKGMFVEFSKLYEKTCYSEKFEVLNFILNFQNLKSWVKAHNAKMLIFPAFSKEYTREYFANCLNLNIFRDHRFQNRLEKVSKKTREFEHEFLLKQVPWEEFLVIDGSRTFFDLCYKNDPKYNPDLSMADVLRLRALANNDWIKPRGHPSELGHDLLAKKLFEIITAV